MKSKIIKTDIISDDHYTFEKVTFELEIEEGKWEKQSREVFDRGNGATIFLYNKKNQTVILTRQFRVPTALNGNTSGMMIEACAGSIEDESAGDSMIRETEEETGYRIKEVTKLFEAYMSPGAVTEIIYFYSAEYDESMKVSNGGGVPGEHEHIEVMEMKFSEALKMIQSGEIKDAKTIMLFQYAKINDLLS